MSSSEPVWPQDVLSTLDLTAGAQFYRCALQVNPYDYVVRNGRATGSASGAAYNEALVAGCVSTGTQVVGLADHHCVASSRSLRAALEAAGIHVFPGFEVRCKDGVQVQVLFEPGTSEQDMTLRLGAIGAEPDDPHGLASVDVPELLARVDSWQAVAVAGQVTYDQGILKHLQGMPRQRVWNDPRLLAAAIPVAVDQITNATFRSILRNEEAGYRRDFPLALLHANDVCRPEDLERPNGWSWIKMVRPTVEGLRSAFRDPESRVRLPSEPQPVEHPTLVAMGWDGAACHLGGSRVRFNDDLNVLVGGRGAGKSTVLESIRFVLGNQPSGTDSRRSYERIVQDVLKPGTRVWLVVRSIEVTPREYLLERVVGGPAMVTARDGSRLDLDPIEAFPLADIWGQREIAELTWDGTARNRLLTRFAPTDPALLSRKRELAKQLESARLQLMQVRQEVTDLDDQIAGLPALEEQASRYAEAGIEQRLGQQAELVRERVLLDVAEERLERLLEAVAALPDALRPDLAFLDAALAEPTANADLIAAARDALLSVDVEAASALEALTQIAARARARANEVRQRWGERSELAELAYAARLREISELDTDGQAYLELRRQLERLGPLRERRDLVSRQVTALQEQRTELLREWQGARSQQLGGLLQAAELVNARLTGSVRVSVTADADVRPLEELLRARVGGNLAKTIAAVTAGRVLASSFADLCRQGPEVLQKELGTSPSQAAKLCQGGPALAEEIEQLDLQPVTEVELKVGKAWRSQDRLSKGQQATAFLLLLLVGAQGAGPLLVDQPEEDLDNRFITESIVPTMRREKRQRQFVFTSHNPNIPVLGDAELIAEVRVELRSAAGSTEELQGRVGPPALVGSIDTPAVRDLVEETLEGGRLAFARRRRKYGF